MISGGFMGDIALPNINYDRELNQDKTHKQDEVEKTKQELLEGLQIEEEGLTAYIRKKTKQPSPFVPSNDPVDSVEEIIKKKNYEEFKKHEAQERLLKTQSNSREIFEMGEIVETTTAGRLRHRNGEKKGNKNRRGRKRHRRKNNKGRNK